MIYSEDDIKLEKLNPKSFEELCFDIIIRFGYKNLSWRQGGADNGRDIEGFLAINNSFIGTYDERWFFECKHYTKGVPPEELYSKIAWANAEKPDHLVIIVSSYLTNGANVWLELIKKDIKYKIHVIEKKALIESILLFPEIISKYFLDKFTKLLLDSRRNWLIHGLFPEPNTFSLLVKELNPSKLSVDELAFLWCAAHLKNSEIDEWFDDNEKFSLDHLVEYLKKNATTKESILLSLDSFTSVDATFGTNNLGTVFSTVDLAEIMFNNNSAIYILCHNKQTGIAIEVLLEASSNFKTSIRYVVDLNDEELLNTNLALFKNFKKVDSIQKN